MKDVCDDWLVFGHWVSLTPPIRQDAYEQYGRLPAIFQVA
jgi:hypothetical protein